jgi:hypothetical protein
MAEFAARPDIILLICAAAFVTYLTRIGGHLLLSRFKHINPRVESALEAVPAAVITSCRSASPVGRTARDAGDRLRRYRSATAGGLSGIVDRTWRSGSGADSGFVGIFG